jgi:hypothetical protein
MSKRFGSGAAAMAWLTGRESKPTGRKKSAATLDREIGEYLSGSSSTPPTATRPPRAPRAAKAPKSTPAKTPRATMTSAEFMSSLPPARSRRGNDWVNDVELAKIIRNECAAAVTAGALPAGTKVSVRILHHKSLSVEIVGWEGAVFSNAYTEHLMDPKGTPWNSEAWSRESDPRLTEPLNRAVKLIEKIADRHNYNNSDYMTDYFDVGYYLSVDARPVEHAAETGIKRESDKTFRELAARAEVAARAVGPDATKSICGRGGVDSADTWALERLIKIADRAKGRPVEYDKRRRGWFPVGS